MTPGRPGVFLDRDGVINVPPPPEQRYITRPEDFRLMPGIAEAIRLFNQARLPVAVVTNQKCVGLGLISEAELGRIHERMHVLLAEGGAHLDAVRFCPDTEEKSPWRKPAPGMILDAAKEVGVDPHCSWMIGDQIRDLRAGRAAGCRTLLVGDTPDPDGWADVRLPDTRGLAAWFHENHPFQGKEDCIGL